PPPRGGAETCQPASVLPSNSSCHPCARSCAVSVLIAWPKSGADDQRSTAMVDAARMLVIGVDYRTCRARLCASPHDLETVALRLILETRSTSAFQNYGSAALQGCSGGR